MPDATVTKSLINSVFEKIGKYGLGAVLSVGLVVWIAVSLNGKLDAQTKQLIAHDLETARLAAAIENLVSQNWQLVAAMQEVCLADPKTNKHDCLNVRPK